MSGTYLHLGGQYVVPRASVAGIFDIDNTTSARSTREMLAAAEKNGEVINAARLPLPALARRTAAAVIPHQC